MKLSDFAGSVREVRGTAWTAVNESQDIKQLQAVLKNFMQAMYACNMQTI